MRNGFSDAAIRRDEACSIPPEGTHEPIPAQRGDVLPRLDHDVNLYMSYLIMGVTAVAALIAAAAGALG